MRRFLDLVPIVFVAFIVGTSFACDHPQPTTVPDHLRTAACVIESLPNGVLKDISAMESSDDKIAALDKLIPAITQCYARGS